MMIDFDRGPWVPWNYAATQTDVDAHAENMKHS